MPYLWTDLDANIKADIEAILYLSLVSYAPYPCQSMKLLTRYTETSKSDDSNDLDDDDKPAKIRVISLESHKAGHVQQQQQSARQPSPSSSQPNISHSKPQRVKSRSPWHSISRRRILCFV